MHSEAKRLRLGTAEVPPWIIASLRQRYCPIVAVLQQPLRLMMQISIRVCRWRKLAQRLQVVLAAAAVWVGGISQQQLQVD